jgi:hypothetical protein
LARLNALNERKKDRNSIHEAVDCTFTVFEEGNRRYLQLDTYGSAERQIRDKVSQSIQLDAESAAALRTLLDRVFPH